MQRGKIAKVTDKGFGFIDVEGNDKGIFFHASDLVETAFNDLRGGEDVEFDLEDGPKGPSAKNVKRV